MTSNCITGIGLLAAAVLTASASPPTYRVDDLGAGWSGTGMNERGDACGTMSPDGTLVLAGVSRDGQPFEVLPLPPGMQSSRAHDINDAGVIVGAVAPNQYAITQPIAAIWTPTPDGYEVELLPAYPGFPYTAAWGINNEGDIIGGAGHFGWFLTTGLQFTEDSAVLLPGGSAASDINDLGMMVAGNTLIDLLTGQTTQIPLPSGNWQGFASTAINNNNDVCGYVIGFSGCSTFPVRYRQSAGWEFLGGCATTTSATDLNDRGDAILYYYSTTSGVHFVDEGYFSVGSLIDASQGAWFVQYGGGAINNARQLLVSARHGLSGPIGAIRLTPIGSSCAADLNDDGALNFFDVQAFLGLFAAGDPAADFTGDGVLNFFDVQAFLAAFSAGCP